MKDEILKYIYERSNMQKKKLERMFERNPQIVADLEGFLQRYERFMVSEGITCEGLAEAYLLMVNQVMHSRIEFLRTGRYPVCSENEAFKNVYDDKRVMMSYMLGLGLSQFLWEHHYKIYKFYLASLELVRNKRKFLEIGSGHGVYVLELLNVVNDFENMDIVDISDTSLKITKKIIGILKPNYVEHINFIKADINLYKSETNYDFITIGEVLEHVENPSKLLKILFNLLDGDGYLFVTTCANCPAIDHTYHFKSVKEIQQILKESGFSKYKEIIVPSEDKSNQELEDLKIDVSYAAILKRID